MTRTSAAFAVVAMIIGTLVAVAVGRSALAPLQSLLAATERVSRNDLSCRAPVTTRNEVGVVAAAFNNALDLLCGQIAERQKAEALLREQTRQIMESANILAVAAGDIVAATSQVVATATESASSVAQTSVTMAEVRQTVQTSNEKAKAVASAARQTAEISQAGKKSTEESVEGMRHIRRQMDSIADSMVRLSEQTQAISQIIATVDDIAAQSNLLAVNAAIEAAKAGEQGKGFSVVAQEVRNLAEQSKQATNQVRAILHDIQRATGAAVMATEQGSKAVEAGVRQSAQAGESIVALATSVNESALAASQIAASNQQQLIGVEQVSNAMENIKQSSAQSAAGTRHLETAARNLSELGEKLRVLTAKYRVEDRIA
jgi:methyl-accepting chemotaxis protein